MEMPKRATIQAAMSGAGLRRVRLMGGAQHQGGRWIGFDGRSIVLDARCIGFDTRSISLDARSIDFDGRCIDFDARRIEKDKHMFSATVQLPWLRALATFPGYLVCRLVLAKK